MTDNFITYCVLNQIMRPDYRRKVITVALDYRGKASKEDRRDLDPIIRKFKGVKGFNNDPTKAPTVRLIEPCIKAFSKDQQLVGILLRLWVDKNSFLENKIIDFLQTKDITVIPSEEPLIGFGSVWPIEKMKEYGEEFVKLNPDENYDDACLMMCYITNQAPVPEDQIDDVQKNLEENGEDEGEEEIKESPEGDETGTIVEAETRNDPDIDELVEKTKEESQTVDEYQKSKSIEAVNPLYIEDKVETPLIQIDSAKFDPVDILGKLVEQLNEVKALIEKAQFDDIYIWLNEYSSKVKSAI